MNKETNQNNLVRQYVKTKNERVLHLVRFFAHKPTEADARRIIDVLFRSSYTQDKEK
jgi:hypothetical protein